MNAFKWGLAVGAGVAVLVSPIIYKATKAGTREIELACNEPEPINKGKRNEFNQRKDTF